MFRKEAELPLAFAKQEKKVRKKLSEYIFPPHKLIPIGISMSDLIIILFLLFIGIFTRVYRIQFPLEIIPNEDRIGQEINYYQSGVYFQDYHNSPFTSMFYYYVSTFMDYDGSMNYTVKTKYCHYKNNPNNNSMNCIHIQFKTISAILSGFCPVLIYLAIRIMFLLTSSSAALFTNRFSAFTAAILITFETSLIAQGRFMLIDGILHHCICASLLFIFLDNFYLLWHTLIGKCIYLSLSVAISPSQSLGIVFATIIREFAFFNPRIILRANYALSRSLFIIVFIIIFQYIVYLFHLKLLPFTNHQFESQIPKFINDSLIDKNNPDWNLRYKKTTFTKLFLQCTYLIFHRNDPPRNMKYESWFWNWPFANFLKSILYVDNYNPNLNEKSTMHHYYSCIPNIFIYLTVFVFNLIGILFIAKTKKRFRKKIKLLIDFIFLFVAYVASLLPFMFTRHAFLYNYLVPLIIEIVFLMNVIEKFINPKHRVSIYIVIIFLALIGFFLFSPYVYGLSKPYNSYFFR